MMNIYVLPVGSNEIVWPVNRHLWHPLKSRKKYLPFANRVDYDHFPVSHKLQCLLIRSSYIGVKLISLSVGIWHE